MQGKDGLSLEAVRAARDLTPGCRFLGGLSL